MAPTIFAIHAHPDDIEITSAGTLFLLKDAGCSLHYMTLARGDAGSLDLDRETTARVRAQEAKGAAEFLGATFHPSIVNDMEVLYANDLVFQVLAIVREVRPDIMLLPSPEDYMEDHINMSRIGVTAAFCRAMPNIISIPSVPPIDTDVVIYEGRQHWWGQGHMQQLYDAQTKGVDRARVDAGKAIRLGTDPIQFMRNQLQMMDCSSAWSLPQALFEEAMSMRVGYKAAYDAVGKLLVQERLRSRVVSREIPDRPRNDRSL